jgi:signal transduction histidine kinase/CheY-like chemotaxis protein
LISSSSTGECRLDLRVRVGLLRHVCNNMREAVVPTIVIVVALAWILADDTNQTAMTWWCGAQIALQLIWAWQMPRIIALEPTHEIVTRVKLGLMLVIAVHGLAWGALAWITLDTASLTGTVLTIAVLLAIPGGATLAVAPLFPVFAAFSITVVCSLGAKLLQLADPAFHVLVGLTTLSLLTFLGQAYKASLAAKSTFALRFENQDLLEKLRLETAHAKSECERADLANQAKSKFLASASHDLRQPIHAQALFLEVLSGTTLTQHQRSVLEHAQSASLASSDMLNTLLDYSKIEAGIVKPYLCAFELQPLLRRIENDLAPMADAKGLVYRSPDTDLMIFSDPSLVEMMLRNLISNAIRYTEQGGVLVVCRLRKRNAVMEVWDTGIGIHSDSFKDIFKEYHQIGNAERNNTKGLGLGLAIVDGLARVLDVGVTVASRLGRGSVFRFPLHVTNAIFAEPVAMGAADPQAFAAECVLVIEDDAMVRAAMHHLLKQWGCENWTAGSIKEAVDIAQRHPPTVILCDYRLQDLATGTQATVAVCNMLGRKIQSVLITGDTDPERLRQARASGIDLLHKPVAPHTLHAALLKAIADRCAVTASPTTSESNRP